jgi:hypothetical protein
MSFPSPLRIAVTGLAATYPFGGVFWDYVQYVLGFLDLGHDVLYVEDTGRWCYDPLAQTFVENGEQNARHLKEQLEQLDDRLAARWFYRDALGNTFGQDWRSVTEFCRHADLFLHISASCWMRDEYFAADRVAFLDSDPMYTQASVPRYLEGTADETAIAAIDMLREHDVFLTFGENIGSGDFLVPTELFDWKPTRQPIVLRCFEPHRIPAAKRRPVLTTVASWEPAEVGPVVNGIQYVGKSREFERFLELPKRSPIPIELAMSGDYPADRLRSHGWELREGLEVSKDPWVYRDYLADSLAEWSVAKNAYAASRSGWFSCRTACYLALGVPAAVQQTAFAIPTGDGVLAFEDEDSAAAAIDELVLNPQHHSEAALEIAREYFDSNKVLNALLEEASSSRPNPVEQKS